MTRIATVRLARMLAMQLANDMAGMRAAILGALRAVRAGVAPVPGLDAAPRSRGTTTGPVPDAEASLGTGPAQPPVDR